MREGLVDVWSIALRCQLSVAATSICGEMPTALPNASEYGILDELIGHHGL